jgi:hypothetical protein
MRVKVYKGSVHNGADNLCESCRYSTIIRGRTLDEEIVRCDAATMHPFKVISCSAYFDAGEPSYGQLLQQAWILRPATSKHPAGFVRSTELPPHEFHACVADLADDGD